MAGGVVILGASHAGVQCAAALRDSGYKGAITLVDEGAEAPYQRPPLSKGFMTGATPLENLALRGDSFYSTEAIALKAGVRAERIVPALRQVVLADGTSLEYETLVIATGGRGRPFLDHEPLGNVHTLRTLQDARQIRAAIDQVDGPVAIIGGGYVGLELAATLRTSFGRDVHVFEASERLLARAASPSLSDLVAQKHRAAGTALHLGCAVAGLAQSEGQVSGVVTDEGAVVATALVVKGVGILPNQELAAACGLACQDGILVDQYCRTSDPSIFAIGDCCRFPDAVSGKMLRLECVQNAHDQARAVASVIVGDAQPYAAVPWFWSDQLGMKLQTAGRWEPGMSCVVRDESEKGKISFFHFSESGRLGAVETVNHPSLHMLARRMLAAGISPNPADCADATFDLKKLLS